MDKRRLGRTDIFVTNICLGSMMWGDQCDEREGHAQLDHAADYGINFIDTAEIYSIPPKAETAGSTERIIGTWFAARKNRDRFILATKVTGRSDMTWLRDGGQRPRANAKNLNEAVDKSLKRLQTDYIDLYQLHWPDRRINLFGGLDYKHFDDDAVPIAETLEAFSALVKAGKIRHVGVSNETAWGVAQWLRAAETTGCPRIVSIQNAYNLVNRTYEGALSEFGHREGVSLLAYSALGQGYLTGKYQNGALPERSRKKLYQRLGRYEGIGAIRAIDSYVDFARANGLDPAALALRFVDTRPFVTSTIIGATSMTQLKADLAAFDLPWTETLEAEMRRLHLEQPNPCP